jgi:primary-amine oxidase
MSQNGPRHPLDPLTADEIARAWNLARAHDGLGPRLRVISVALAEPLRSALSGTDANRQLERAAFVVLMDSGARKTYEAVVSLTQARVVSWKHVPGVQPAIVLDEFFECEAAVRADPGWQAAMRRRGVTDFSLAMVDAWSAGNFGIEDEKGRRLSRTLTWVRRSPTDNGYARPVANLIATVDLDEMKVIAIEDYGVVPLPPEDANYAPDVAGSRSDLRPLEIRQPQGPSFTLDGHELAWQKWRMRLGFTPGDGMLVV